jgi:DNA invertase Pin-like site-specific DNA recombinase
MPHQVVGYIRISSQGQNTARQLADVKLDKEFVDIMSGNTKEREKLIECIDYVREGDTLVVDSIDRLARNLRHLQEILDTLIKKGVSVRFIKENLLFTGNSDPMSTLTLHMMGAFAEFERTMIKSRQREGIDAAKKIGKHLGRPSVLSSKHEKQAKELKAQGVSIRKIAMTMNLSRGSIYKLLGENK